MTEVPESLRSLPLFNDLNEAQLKALFLAFESRSYKKGETIFEAETSPNKVHLLLSGSVSVRSGEDEVLIASPPCPLGELGALTGDDRLLSAVAAEDAEVLEAPLDRLQEVLQDHGKVGYLVLRNLLRLASRKIGRDRRRLEEMRNNIINTQKAMKAMRDALLEAEDNLLHASLFEELDALIEQNRRIHYLVEPSRLVPTFVKLDEGVERRVTAVSNEWLLFREPPKVLEENTEFTAILLLDGKEIPVSGTVEKCSEKEAAIFLDELVPPYEEALSLHLTRAQILDVVL